MKKSVMAILTAATMTALSVTAFAAPPAPGPGQTFTPSDGQSQTVVAEGKIDDTAIKNQISITMPITAAWAADNTALLNNVISADHLILNGGTTKVDVELVHVNQRGLAGNINALNKSNRDIDRYLRLVLSSDKASTAGGVVVVAPDAAVNATSYPMDRGFAPLVAPYAMGTIDKGEAIAYSFTGDFDHVASSAVKGDSTFHDLVFRFSL